MPREPRHELMLPSTQVDIQAAALRSRKLVTQRAIVAAGVAMVPVPGLDWLTDVGVLVRLLPEINRQFGLTPEQVARLSPSRRVAAYKALHSAGGLVVGKLVTRELVLHMLRVVGVRLTTQQAAKFVPIAGQAASAALTYSALKLICERHIRDCIAVCDSLAVSAPAADDPNVIDL